MNISVNVQVYPDMEGLTSGSIVIPSDRHEWTENARLFFVHHCPLSEGKKDTNNLTKQRETLLQTLLHRIDDPHLCVHLVLVLAK